MKRLSLKSFTQTALGVLTMLSLGLSPIATHAKGNISQGAEKFASACVACHGSNGLSKSADFPILAGQHEDYLKETLRAYKSGDRKNAIMKAQAANLSDKDIEDIAAFLSKQSGLRTAY